MVPSLVLVTLLLDFRADRIVLLQNTWRQVDTLRLLMGFREQRAKSNSYERFTIWLDSSLFMSAHQTIFSLHQHKTP